MKMCTHERVYPCMCICVLIQADCMDVVTMFVERIATRLIIFFVEEKIKRFIGWLGR